MTWIARAIGDHDPEGVPLDAPAAPHALYEALSAAGHDALADELVGLRCLDHVRRAFVARALASATDVDAVRLRPLPDEAARSTREHYPLDFVIELDVVLDRALADHALVLPRDALARLLQPIVAGLLVDEGCARDLGTAEPLALATHDASPHAARMVDPRIDAALEERPLVVSRGQAFGAAWAVRVLDPGAHAGAIGAALHARLGLTDAPSRILVHLPLGQQAIDEAAALAAQP
ncbi:MAG: hypothetical protein J0L92_31440 [Deltaproteobacteria bacterium]|nr:hypothetical protein [Deltaproteobacteria bacterium]